MTDDGAGAGPAPADPPGRKRRGGRRKPAIPAKAAGAPEVQLPPAPPSVKAPPAPPGATSAGPEPAIRVPEAPPSAQPPAGRPAQASPSAAQDLPAWTRPVLKPADPPRQSGPSRQSPQSQQFQPQQQPEPDGWTCQPSSLPKPPDGRARIAFEDVRPELDGGRFPVKRIVGDIVRVEADIVADGHDELSAFVLYRKEGAAAWSQAPMRQLGNDRWAGEFAVSELGAYRYTLKARVEPYATWLRDLKKRLDAGQDVSAELLVGAGLAAAASARAAASDKGEQARRLHDLERELGWTAPAGGGQAADTGSAGGGQAADRAAAAADPDLAALVARWGGEERAVRYGRELEVWVDRERARFSAWYEVFPRSCSPHKGRHGTFADLAARLPYIAGMGFDVLYLPPIHPVGRTHRKGRNNSLETVPGDPGSPWAIGDELGGHKAIAPQLGTIEDFRALVGAAAGHGVEVALDVALQCSPDHPYLREHPEWFRRKPDGSLRYAENPPKKYEDIYPLDFSCEAWEALWEEARGIFRFWMDQGVRIFRVDNPHTKPFAFWEWLIRDLRQGCPELVFLSEAFTRPKLMYRLAKAGFTQSYNYFPWRNTKWELETYLTELTRTQAAEFFRPNLWTNTPDILTAYLQEGGRPAFVVRHVLAATLGASYGIYGPAFELCVGTAKGPGQEEYLDSEKYELKHWPLDSADGISGSIARVNRIRRENPALHSNESLRFFRADNERLICYGKRAGDDVVVVVVNLDPRNVQSGWVELPLEELGLAPDKPYQLHDLFTGRHYLWQGPRNYVELDPVACPAHICRLKRWARTENDVDFFV